MQREYRFPAEWEKQSGVLITWPHEYSDWVDHLSDIEAFYVELSKTITTYEKLLIIVYDASHEQHVTSLLDATTVDLTQIQFFRFNTNDTWTRDYGPLYLTDGVRLKCLDFTFNAWGNKFPSEKDNQLSCEMLKQEIIMATDVTEFDFVLEGGSVDSNGAGTLLTTKACLLNDNRNPKYNASQIEEFVRTTFNVKEVIWLSEGMIIGDDTDSHIDMLARFTDEKTIVYSACNDNTDPHYEPLQNMHQELLSLKTSSDENYRLVPLPIPKAIYDEENNRLPASYANFLIINDAVLLPIYDDPHDELAINALESCFPQRKVIPINAKAAITQGGSLHCLTMQLLDGVLSNVS